jgi:hypothetical protein
MPYPRLLKLDQKTKDRLITFLNDELINHRVERQDYIAQVEGWQRDYWAAPTTEVRTFPFRGASNIVIPLTAIAWEAVHARTMTTLFALDQFVSVEMRVPDAIPGTDQALERYMDYELIHSMKIRRPVNDVIAELEKFGTGVAKPGYERIVRTAVRTIGETEEEVPIVIKDSPTIDPVPVTRFMMPFVSQDPQTALWVGEEHSWIPFEIEEGERSGLFEEGTMEKLKAHILQTNQPSESGSGQTNTAVQEGLEKREPIFPKRLEFFELWMAFDIDDSGEDLKEIQVFYHRESQVLMAVRYNWHDDLHRPYRYENYVGVEHRWAGVGIAKQNEQFQREITTIHRQRLDNATLANMRMFKVHKMSGYGPNEPVFPGKMWFVDDMTHIEAFQIGEVYNSSFANEQASVLYSQQRTGVNEVILGMPTAGTPGTATGDLARIQEGSKRFDASFGNIKILMNQLIVDTLVNIKQFGTRNTDYFSLVENGELVAQLLQQPISSIRRGILFRVGVIDQRNNRLVDRQNWAQIATILQQYYDGMIRLTAATGNQQLLGLVFQKGLIASTEAMRQILESFDVRNIDRILVTEVEKALRDAQNTGSQQLLGAGGTVGPGGNGAAQGLGSLQEVINALTGGASGRVGEQQGLG